MGPSVDLPSLGRLCPVETSTMMDNHGEVTVDKALNTPKIVFTPKRRKTVWNLPRTINHSHITTDNTTTIHGTE